MLGNQSRDSYSSQLQVLYISVPFWYSNVYSSLHLKSIIVLNSAWPWHCPNSMWNVFLCHLKGAQESWWEKFGLALAGYNMTSKVRHTGVFQDRQAFRQEGQLLHRKVQISQVAQSWHQLKKVPPYLRNAAGLHVGNSKRLLIDSRR